MIQYHTSSSYARQLKNAADVIHFKYKSPKVNAPAGIGLMM